MVANDNSLWVPYSSSSKLLRLTFYLVSGGAVFNDPDEDAGYSRTVPE